MGYEDLLNDAYDKVKPIEHSDRFEVLKVEGHVEGTKTILTNLHQIASALRRDINHLFKFLLRETASSGKLESNRVVLQRKVPSAKINEKIEAYANEFVICKECKKPDTELTKEKDFSFVRCLACGAKHSVRGKI